MEGDRKEIQIVYQQKAGTEGGCGQAPQTGWSPWLLQPESGATADRLGRPQWSASGGAGAAAAWDPVQAACRTKVGFVQHTSTRRPLAMTGRCLSDNFLFSEHSLE